MSDTLPFNSAAAFLFNAPLYAVYTITRVQLNSIVGDGRENIDGFCPYCHQSTPFFILGANRSDVGTRTVEGLNDMRFIHSTELKCTRRNHAIHIYLYVKGLTIQKIGQYPSLADIANDESKTYKSVLEEQDSRELHKAIGLAAHGVGIGSFVYFRRIFERLIRRRFDEFKVMEAWTDEEFYRKRMSEKIEFLRSHLPTFVVENHKIYSILSLAVHELSEERCLQFFPVIKASVIVMLDEDKKKKEGASCRMA